MSLSGRLKGQGSPDASGNEANDGESTAPSSDSSTVVGERGIASINRAHSLQSRVSNLLAMGLMSALGLGLLTWYYAQTFARQAHARQEAQVASRAKANGEMTLPALGRVDPPRPVSDADRSAIDQFLGPAPELPSAQAASFRATDYQQVPGAGAQPPATRPTDRRLDGPVFTSPGDTGGGGGAAGAAPATIAAAPQAWSASGSIADGGAANDRSAALLKPSLTPAVRASVLPTQQMLLAKGAFIDCTLETAIDSSLPGLTTCITATDTFGVDGKVVLLERGTKLVGETRGEVQQGSARVFVLWTEARTPTGVIVPLASPGTDELGRSGLASTVDRHFLERFGAAMLISVINGAVQAAAESRSNGGTVIYSPGGSQDVLTEVLKSTVNIPPTVRKQNGDRIQVLVARDLDFRSVYELRTDTDAR